VETEEHKDIEVQIEGLSLSTLLVVGCFPGGTSETPAPCFLPLRSSIDHDDEDDWDALATDNREPSFIWNRVKAGS
jgi:hypothetical protein